MEMKLPKDKKRLAEAVRVQAEANRLREFYLSRNAEGRERLMEMANAVNYDHYKMKADDLAVTQLAAVKSERPLVTGVEGVRSAESARPGVSLSKFSKYLEAFQPVKATVNSPRWDFISQINDKYVIIQMKDWPR